MATCKQCVNYDDCCGYIPTDLDKDVWDLCAKGLSDEIPDIENRCSGYRGPEDWEQYVKLVHAEWIDRYGNKYANHLWRCSACGENALWSFKVDELGHAVEHQDLSDYCPHCGAKMD